MKIVMLCDFYNHTLQYQENFLAKYYRKYGHDVTIIASTFESIFDYMSSRYNRKAMAHESFVDGVKIIKLPYSLNVLNKLRKFGGVDKILEAEKPDIIFVHSLLLNLKEAVRYKKKNPDAKIIMDYHADYSNSAHDWLSLNILHKIIRKLFLHYRIKYIDKIYAVTPASKLFLHEVYSIPYERINVLPLGVDTDFVSEVKKNRPGQLIREKLNIPEDDCVIFTGGKLDRAKRTHLLIEAFKALSNPHLHLIVVGEPQGKDGAYKADLEKLSEGNRQIYFTGWLSGKEVYDYMDAADFAVFPASQSVLWQQATGMGLPLIVGQLQDQTVGYLNKNNNVIVISEDKVNDAQEIANIIKYLIDNPAELDAMKKGALKMVSDFLSYDKIVRQTLEFS